MEPTGYDRQIKEIRDPSEVDDEQSRDGCNGKVADEQIRGMLVLASVLHANHEIMGRQRSSVMPILLSTVVLITCTCK